MKKIFCMLALLAVTLSACNLPIPQESGMSVNDQAATIVAQTLTAIHSENLVPLASPTAEQNLTPLASPTAEQNLTPLASPTASGGAPTLQPNLTSTATTGTPTATIVTVDANTNCREGPGTSYAIVIQLVPGTSYQMIARTADNKYWIVTEIGKATQCWVPAEFSNAFGNVNLLPVTTPSAATSAAGTIQAPGRLIWRFDCTAPPNIRVKLSWTDYSENEIGFRIYRDGALVIELPTNTTSYVDLFVGNPTVTYGYQVSSYNATGEALSGAIFFSCQ